MKQTSDILAQPAVWLSLLLLLGSIPAIAWLTDTVPGLVFGLLAGPLLTLAAGWAWWRTTATFMGYLEGAGRFLVQKAAVSAARQRQMP